MKTLKILLVCLIAIISAAGCSHNDQQSVTDSSKTVTLKIISTADTASQINKTVLPSEIDSLIAGYTLLGCKTGGTLAELSSFTLLSDASVTVETGCWDFRLQAKNSSSTVLVEGTLTNVSVTSDTTLAFTLQPLSSGMGSVNITINFPSTVGVSSVETALDGTVLTSGVTLDTANYTIVYSQTGLIAGEYPVFFKLKDPAGTVITVVSEIIRISPNLTSSKTITLTSADFNTKPAAPSGLTAVLTGSTSTTGNVTLNWTDNSNNETGFTIVWSGNSTTGTISVPAATTSYTWTSAVRGASYTFKIMAINSFGNSDYTTETSSLTVSVLRTVTFDSQGGSTVTSQKVESGGTITSPTVPTYSGYAFVGWYKEAACTTVWTFATDTVTADITLYAKWALRNAWTWVSGSSSVTQAGTYGTKGTAASTNIPGARYYSTSLTDSSGNLWLFGGYGYDSTGSSGTLNDLWKYDGTNWTWVSGSSSAEQFGVYGTQGTAASTNMPGTRRMSTSWIDSSGNFWIFGGYGSSGFLNDLWKFDGTNWTWVSGSSDTDQSTVYGTKGVAASTNVPGARYSSSGWIDSSGNLWLFGGMGYDSTGAIGRFNDLWKFDGTNWTWVSGSSSSGQAGIYGTKGVASSTNAPGPHLSSITWTDSSGNFWLFGGWGYDSTGSFSLMNDLWKYDGTNWTWVSGASTYGSSGTYGTKGTASSTNAPGSRTGSIGWKDSSGNFWIFGGNGYDSTGSKGYLNDLWKYDGTNWTWVSGASTRNQTGIYGTKGTAASANVPGSRDYGVSWKDSSGNFWFFGGMGYDSAGSNGELNDLWKYTP